MFDDLLEERLRTIFRHAGDELSLSVTAGELERRLTVRRRARKAQRSALLAAAVGIVAVGAVVGSAPSWFRQTQNQGVATASPLPTATAAATTSVPSASPEPSAPAMPAGQAPIVRYLTQDWRAFEIAVDGTGRRAVPTFDIDPERGVLPEDPWPGDRSVSPDGRLRVTVNGDEVRVHSIDADATDTTFTFPLGDSPGETRISWSPDGRHLAVWSEGNGPLAPHSMWVVDVATGRTTAGPVETIGFITAAWSPDGARIADGSREGLYVVTASTGETKVLGLGADVSGYMDLQWAPDGRGLVFSPVTVAYEIHRLNPDTMASRRLALGAGARWAPDGSKVFYLRESGGPVGPAWHFEIWTMRPDGSDKRPLMTKPCPCSALQLSPDGQWLIFVASRGEYGDVWVVGTDGRNARRVARDTNIAAWVSP
jgi:dipeptidyl aminopeptidase/acylaminoacyl peptidase